MRICVFAKNIRLSAQKGRLVANLIRGKTVQQALNMLGFSSKKGAILMKKALQSAVANAAHNESVAADCLRVDCVFVDKGSSLKRFSARAKGRGNRVEKQTCHMALTVSNEGVINGSEG